MTLTDLVNQFPTTPFLFVGSGMSRRYANLPNWKGLLEDMAKAVTDDEFAYSAYENKAKTLSFSCGLMPKIAELIQHDFDAKWFRESSIRTVTGDDLELIKNGASPFKVELAAHIRNNYEIDTALQSEIKKLTDISQKSIAGIITTNYDTFLEDHFAGFKKYVGQDQLIFSSIQGVAEIYKIHGSIEDPTSIVINEADYEQFNTKSAYLAAKLMTIFMEYPIVFMGYSITDSNIQNIIKSIVTCLNEQQVKQLENRFVFVQYQRDAQDISITPYAIMIDEKPLSMTKVILSDFLPLYDALGTKQAKLPVRILRRFKEELYSYVITNSPTATLRVASIDDARIRDDDFVLSIGRADQYGIHGLSGINGNDWYRNIILDDLKFSADELLEHAFPNVAKQNSGTLPLNKYLSMATKDFPECVELAKIQTFDKIISNTIKKNRHLLKYTYVKQVWDAEKNDIYSAANLISHLEENCIDITELEDVLREIFISNPSILEVGTPYNRTHIRRLIRIYDYLKWGKK